MTNQLEADLQREEDEKAAKANAVDDPLDPLSPGYNRPSHSKPTPDRISKPNIIDDADEDADDGENEESDDRPRVGGGSTGPGPHVGEDSGPHFEEGTTLNERWPRRTVVR